MVKLEEVPDEEFEKEQPGPREDEDEWDTDDESEISEVDDDDALDESLLDRVYALKDIVPPTYRKNITSVAETGYSWISSSLSFTGKAAWILSTSTLLLGVPWALAFSEEQQVQEMEKEMRMQQSASELLTAGSGAGQTNARPAL